MSLAALASILHRCLPHVSDRTRIIIDAAILNRGRIGTARHVAVHLGLPSRFALARLLKRDGLPPLKDLAAWVSVLVWVDSANCGGRSLCQLAFRARKDPGFCYRTVRRITGHTWGEIRLRGLAWVLKLFLAHCFRQAGPEVRRGQNPYVQL